MIIDDNEMEIEACELFKKGEKAKAAKLQREFLQKVKESGIDHCSCHEKCGFHGKCMECVIMHRGHGDHLPVCFWKMASRRVGAGTGLTSH